MFTKRFLYDLAYTWAKSDATFYKDKVNVDDIVFTGPCNFCFSGNLWLEKNLFFIS